MQKIRILLIAANPSDTTRIAVGEEQRRIDAAIRATDGHDRFDLVYAQETRIDELGQALQRHRPDVVHFTGHGSSDGELLLNDASGRAQPANPEALAALFGVLSRDLKIRCVMLNACYSEPLAKALAAHVDCVIGTSGAYQDRVAVNFAAGFYQALGFGRDVEAAYRYACNQVDLILPDHGSLPSLHCRAGIKPEALRFVDLAAPEESTPARAIQRLLGDRYEVEALVASGELGDTWRGRHQPLDRPVSIKVFRSRPGAVETDARARAERFKREAELVARFAHPDVARVLEYGVGEFVGGDIAQWLVAEWVGGESLHVDLQTRRGRGGRAPPEVLELMRPIFGALAAAHAFGASHSDLKPSCIKLEQVASSTDPHAVRARLVNLGVAHLSDDRELTPSFVFTGRAKAPSLTLPYAAPEQVNGEPTRPTTDVHALGLIVTELLVDEAPYRERAPSALMIEVLSAPRPTPARFGVDVGAWEAVIARAVAARPAERFENAAAFLHALEQALPESRHARRREMVEPKPEAPRHEVVIEARSPESSKTRRVLMALGAVVLLALGLLSIAAR